MAHLSMKLLMLSCLVQKFPFEWLHMLLLLLVPNPSGTKKILANGVSTFFIYDNAVVINCLKTCQISRLIK